MQFFQTLPTLVFSFFGMNVILLIAEVVILLGDRISIMKKEDILICLRIKKAFDLKITLAAFFIWSGIFIVGCE